MLLTHLLIKSKKSVADHGEVFTPPWLVEAMLDFVKGETERIDSRFLEPAFKRSHQTRRAMQKAMKEAIPRQAPQAFSAKFNRAEDRDLPKDAPRRLKLDRRLREDPAGRRWFRIVTGTTLDGRKTLVIWHKRPGGEAPEGIEQDNLILDEWFTKRGYSSKDSEFDLIYVNGDNNLENPKAPDDTWKVRLIEEDFFRLMFAEEVV